MIKLAIKEENALKYPWIAPKHALKSMQTEIRKTVRTM